MSLKPRHYDKPGDRSPRREARLVKSLVVLTCVTLGTLAAIHHADNPSTTVRYQIGGTIRFEGQQYWSSSVWESTYRLARTLHGRQLDFETDGDALSFDLGGGRVLFLLSRPAAGETLPLLLQCYRQVADLPSLVRAISRFRSACLVTQSRPEAVLVSSEPYGVDVKSIPYGDGAGSTIALEALVANASVEQENTSILARYPMLASMASRSVGSSSLAFIEDFTAD